MALISRQLAISSRKSAISTAYRRVPAHTRCTSPYTRETHMNAHAYTHMYSGICTCMRCVFERELRAGLLAVADAIRMKVEEEPRREALTGGLEAAGARGGGGGARQAPQQPNRRVPAWS